MIEAGYTLHDADGGIREEERQCEQVPRVGELIAFEFERSYQVVDVLWHFMQSHYVTVTACEVNWHKHISDVLTQWQASQTDARPDRS